MKKNDDINYKLTLITKKLKANLPLTQEEKEYLKQSKRVEKVAKYISLRQELENLNPQAPEIIDFINEIEKLILERIPKTASKKRLQSLRKSLIRIKDLKSGYLRLLKEYVIDNYPKDSIRLDSFILNLMQTDDYTCNATSIGGHRNEFIKSYNHYTRELVIDEPTITLALELLGGNWELYYSVDELNDSSKEQDWSNIPDNVKKANTNALKRIAYYGRGRIGNQKESKLFNKTRDILEFILYLSKTSHEQSHEHYVDIINFFKQSILDYIELPEFLTGKKTARINETELTKYIPVLFFTSNEPYNYRKFRQLLAINDYDIKKVLYTIIKDDLISKTKLGKDKNGFINEDGSLNYANIKLAALYVTGNFTYYNALVEYYKSGNSDYLKEVPEELQSADPSHLERIVYYGRGRICNADNHDFDQDFYDLQVLEALALEQEYYKILGIDIWESKQHTKKMI